MRVRQ